MSSVIEDISATQAPGERMHERHRGILAMWLFIATDGMFFTMVFFSYFYLGASQPYWPLIQDPSYWRSLIMLGILLLSSGSAYWAERSITHGRTVQLRLGIVLTLILGGLFLFVGYWEYAAQLNAVTPWASAYGSIFYTIVTLHMAHLVLGMCMLLFVLARAFAGHFTTHRNSAVKNVVHYWHYVGLIWVFVVAILYLSPQFYGAGQ